MPEFWDEFLVTLTEGRLFVSPNQTTAVQEELSERRTGEERRTNIIEKEAQSDQSSHGRMWLYQLDKAWSAAFM